MAQILWVIAVLLFVYGVVTAIQGDVVKGIAICVAALLIGPGGVSLFL